MLLPRRATIYLDPQLHRALKLKAVQTDRSISDLVNQAVQQSLAEDASDLQAIDDRKDQADRDFSAFVRDLRRNGLV